MPPGEQSEERVTLYRCGLCGELSFGLCARGRCHGIMQVPGVEARPIRGKPEEFVRVSPSPVDTERCTCSHQGLEPHFHLPGCPIRPVHGSDTDSCPTCGNTEPRYFNEQFCPDPWHSRSQAGEG